MITSRPSSAIAINLSVPLNCICVLENIDPVIGVLNSGEALPYRGPVGGGRLIDARDIIFECSPDYYIAQGDFVCEYVGELRNCNAALPNPYTLEIDCEQRIKGHRGKRISNPRTIQGIWTLDKRPAEESSESPEFCIDSLFRGNVSRFVNHSCEPNLFSPSVMYNHSANEKAIKASRVVLFAKRDISVNEELTFDYGQRRRKEFVCYCDFCQGHRG
ncbi:hypothetical protein M0R45_025099 [Rubus argutus]|uniref:SET domain-containing protein n=1 Tax=Rubus argutus TaxID=59490 RepID=A0AAW1WSZ6_RUBAR